MIPTVYPDMHKDRDAHSVLYVDPFSGDDHNHLYDDDLFLSECIAPLTREFLVATSFASGANLRRQLNVETCETPRLNSKTLLQRFRLLRLFLSLPCSRFQHVVFQSFEELSVLFFMFCYPSKRVHLIVTNNLRPDRFKRHPMIGPFFLCAVFRNAASVIVHSSYEVNKVKEIAPSIDSSKVFVKPFHQFGFNRVQLSWQEKSRTILFLGPACVHKKVEPVIDLINGDKERRFRYVFCSMRESMAPQTRAFLEAQNNVGLSFGYTVADEYYRLFSEAALIILTHDKDFEGTLSGAFCDAIASGTPVIARDMAPHNEFFERFGPMGFLVDYDIPEWYKHVLGADFGIIYNVFQQNMAACRASCTMEANREMFREILARE